MLGLWPTTRTFSEAEHSRSRRWNWAKVAEGASALEMRIFCFVAGFGGDELGGLLAALEGAGDDEVEAELEGVEDVGELQALGLAVLVEGTLDVEERIGAAEAGAGVAEDEEIHCLGLDARSGGVGVGWRGRGERRRGREREARVRRARGPIGDR